MSPHVRPFACTLAVALLLPLVAAAQVERVDAAWEGLAFDPRAFDEVVRLTEQMHVVPKVPEHAWVRAAEGGLRGGGLRGFVLPVAFLDRERASADGRLALAGPITAVACAVHGVAPFAIWQPEREQAGAATTLQDLRQRRQQRRDLARRARAAWTGVPFGRPGFECAMNWARHRFDWPEPLVPETAPPAQPALPALPTPTAAASADPPPDPAVERRQLGLKAWRLAADFFLHALDAHSTILPGRLFDAIDKEAGGTELVGVGLDVVRESGAWVVRRLAADGPAEKAGVRAGDVLLAVGGEPADAWTDRQLGDALSGADGSAVVLKVQSARSRPRNVTAVRQAVEQSSVVGSLFGEGTGVGVLRLPQFATNTARDARRELANLGREARGGLQAVVLDMRGNPGGWVEEAVATADALLGEGIVVRVQTRDGEVERPEAKADPDDFTLPMAVLVDTRCKSACELLTAALQDHGRVLVVGQPTFGKGSVQKVLESKRGDWYVILTIAQYLSPNGRALQASGVRPDVELPGLAASGQALREVDFMDALDAAAANMPAVPNPLQGADLTACVAKLQRDSAGWREARRKKDGPLLAAVDHARCLGSGTVRQKP
ncbi:MAG: hypothetical protein EXR79_07890 [Myxococcales bacterium]|nr:hypothetical protein [Myxococcales bacterium]